MAVQRSKRMRRLNLVRSTIQEEETSSGVFLCASSCTYLRRQGATLVTPHMSLPINTTTNCDLFKTPTLYNDNTYIAANG